MPIRMAGIQPAVRRPDFARGEHRRQFEHQQHRTLVVVDAATALQVGDELAQRDGAFGQVVAAGDAAALEFEHDALVVAARLQHDLAAGLQPADGDRQRAPHGERQRPRITRDGRQPGLESLAHDDRHARLREATAHGAFDDEVEVGALFRAGSLEQRVDEFVQRRRLGLEQVADQQALV
jgi:hypothetical protein